MAEKYGGENICVFFMQNSVKIQSIKMAIISARNMPCKINNYVRSSNRQTDIQTNNRHTDRQTDRLNPSKVDIYS